MSSHHDISMASLEVLRAGLDALGAGDGTIIDFTTFPEAVPADPDWPHPPSVVFLNRLPKVNLADLPRDATACIICRVRYDIRHPKEHPVALPCSHIVGSRCISQYLNPITGDNNTTCPDCRQEFFPKSYRINTDAGLLDLMSMVDWVTQLVPLNDDEKRTLKALRDAVVTHVYDAEDSRANTEEIFGTLIDDPNNPPGEYVRGRYSRGYYFRCVEDEDDGFVHEQYEEERDDYQGNMVGLNHQVPPILIEDSEHEEMTMDPPQQLMDNFPIGSENFPVVIGDGEDLGVDDGARSNQQRISWSVDAGNQDSPIKVYDSEDEAERAADAARSDMTRPMYD